MKRIYIQPEMQVTLFAPESTILSGSGPMFGLNPTESEQW